MVSKSIDREPQQREMTKVVVSLSDDYLDEIYRYSVTESGEAHIARGAGGLLEIKMPGRQGNRCSLTP